MPITFELPAAIEQQIRRDLADFDGVAKEAALVELYRQGRVTHHQLAMWLNLSRIETDDLLKRRKVVEDLETAERVCQEVATLRRLLGG